MIQTQQFHSTSHVPMVGTLLGEGTLLRENDHYAANGGAWEPCPVPGVRIRSGCMTVWVRPRTELSPEAMTLLAYLARSDYYLMHRGEWIVIPSLSLKHDTRIHWRVLHPQCVNELEECGLIQPLQSDDEVYELTDSGREYLSLMN